MIHANADTAEDIADLLRGRGDVSQKIIAEKVAARLLGKKLVRGIVVTAPRQSGKTTELLRCAEQNHPNGNFCVVSPNLNIQRSIGLLYWELMGKKIVSPTPPLMLTPDNLRHPRTLGRPTFVDEWNLLPESTQQIVLESGMFVAAVTS